MKALKNWVQDQREKHKLVRIKHAAYQSGNPSKYIAQLTRECMFCLFATTRDALAFGCPMSIASVQVFLNWDVICIWQTLLCTRRTVPLLPSSRYIGWAGLARDDCNISINNCYNFTASLLPRCDAIGLQLGNVWQLTLGSTVEISTRVRLFVGNTARVLAIIMYANSKVACFVARVCLIVVTVRSRYGVRSYCDVEHFRHTS